MKNVVLFLSLFLLSATASGQTEELVTDGDTKNAAIKVDDQSSDYPGKGIWGSYFGSNKSAEIWNETDDVKGNVIKIKALAPLVDVQNNPRVVQRIDKKELVPAVYRLSFYARSTNPSVPVRIAASIRPKYTTTEFVAFKLNDFVVGQSDKQSAAYKHFDLSDEWKLYSIEVDLSFVVNEFGTPSYVESKGRKLQVNKSRPSHRKDVVVAFSNLYRNTSTPAGAELAVTGVSLKQISE